MYAAASGITLMLASSFRFGVAFFEEELARKLLAVQRNEIDGVVAAGKQHGTGQIIRIGTEEKALPRMR